MNTQSFITPYLAASPTPRLGPMTDSRSPLPRRPSHLAQLRARAAKRRFDVPLRKYSILWLLVAPLPIVLMNYTLNSYNPVPQVREIPRALITESTQPPVEVLNTPI